MVVLVVGVEVEEDWHNEASLEAANDHTVDIDYTVEVYLDYDTVEDMVVDNSSRCTGACTHCTEVPPQVDRVEFDDHKVSSFPYLVACLALPADDGRSSCRLVKVLYFQTYPIQVGLDWKELCFARELISGLLLDGGNFLNLFFEMLAH